MFTSHENNKQNKNNYLVRVVARAVWRGWCTLPGGGSDGGRHTVCIIKVKAHNLNMKQHKWPRVTPEQSHSTIHSNTHTRMMRRKKRNPGQDSNRDYPLLSFLTPFGLLLSSGYCVTDIFICLLNWAASGHCDLKNYNWRFDTSIHRGSWDSSWVTLTNFKVTLPKRASEHYFQALFISSWEVRLLLGYLLLIFWFHCLFL